MRVACRDDVDLAGANRNDVTTQVQVHLPVQDKQRLGELVHFVWIRAAVHAKDFDVRSSGTAHNHRAPCLLQCCGALIQVDLAHLQSLGHGERTGHWRSRIAAAPARRRRTGRRRLREFASLHCCSDSLCHVANNIATPNRRYASVSKINSVLPYLVPEGRVRCWHSHTKTSR
jgi:hypothetical protein